MTVRTCLILYLKVLVISAKEFFKHRNEETVLIGLYRTPYISENYGVTSKDLEQVVQILTVAVNNALQIFLSKSLDDLVPELIYTDSLINTIAKALNSLKNNNSCKGMTNLPYDLKHQGSSIHQRVP